MTMKGRVALEPFPDMSVKTTTSGAGPVKVVRIENRTALVPLRVVFSCFEGPLVKGLTALVRGNQYTQPWAKEIHEIEGQKFILAPDAVVEAFFDGG